MDGNAGNVIHWLLCSERDPSGLSVEAHQPGTWILRAEAVLHQPVPDLARGAELGDLLEEIVMRVKEEAESRTKLVDVQPATLGPIHVFDAVVDREREFLQRRRAGF